MNVSAPRAITWSVALILGVLGVLGHLGTVAALTQYSFWLVTAGLALLLVATLIRNL